MRDYQQTIDFLYNSFPMFQNIGAGAYKPGLERMEAMLGTLGNPHRAFPVIHVAGTNGKGSTAHTLAAVLRSAGYKTGLFTSPHLVDFRERIRIDGEMIPKERVVEFVDSFGGVMPADGMAPSFFELTTAMALDWFARSRVDVAVIEVGLGGRLDSTNVVNPVLSVITNISFDHVALLGDTLEKIAAEKAGIIKPGVPVVIGESADNPGVRKVFADKAAACEAPVVYADDKPRFESCTHTGGMILYRGTEFGDISGQLTGDCQLKNTATILCALRQLRESGWKISDADVARGFSDVCGLTGLAGRWMRSRIKGIDVICDTGHNVGGWQYLAPALAGISGLRMVIGFVNDKDVRGILSMMPRNARYYFAQAGVRRALPASELAGLAAREGISGRTFGSVREAVDAAVADSEPGDTVFVGGSTFVVADFLSV